MQLIHLQQLVKKQQETTKKTSIDFDFARTLINN